jgi:hypothetical protein
MSIIAHDIESKCRRIARKVTKHASDSTPTTFIGREMALALDHIDAIRKRHASQRAQLLEKELEIGTQILIMEERIDLIPNRMERMRLVQELKQSLDRITMAAQRLAIETESASQQLQVRLLKLWNMYDQLSIEHGDTESTP